MTTEETAKILSVLRLTYPTFCSKTDEMKAAVKLWADIFADDDYTAVGAAVRAFIATDEKGFPPVPGQVKAKLRLMRPSAESAIMAWGRVLRALRDADTYRDMRPDGTFSRPHYLVAWDKLPTAVQRAIGDPGTLIIWGRQDEGQLSYTYSSFERAYNAETEKANTFEALPARDREALAPNVAKLLADGGIV